MDFIYDDKGAPYAMKYNGTTYYYVVNLQGDVIAIMNSAGTRYGIYRYDAWGNITYQTNSSILALNPIRYRGYVYDTDLEMYYLQSRYYDPEIGRFINADRFASTGQDFAGYNMFAYCGNNPVIRQDDGGTFWHLVCGAVIGAVLSGGTKLAECIAKEESLGSALGQIVVSTVCGAVGGALAATGIGATGQAVIGMTLGAIESVSNQMISSREVNTTQLITDTLSGGLGGFLGGDGAAHGSKFMAHQTQQFFKKFSLYGFDEAITSFARKTGKWAGQHLIEPTIESVGKAFFWIKMISSTTNAFLPASD